LAQNLEDGKNKNSAGRRWNARLTAYSPDRNAPDGVIWH
jgi:hypothetical protein